MSSFQKPKPKPNSKPAQKTQRRPRPYHQVDDDGSEFEYELPDWLVGAD